MSGPDKGRVHGIPITIVDGRGLIFDIKDVIRLRKEFHMCGTLVGVLPQFPQQNVFLGLPLELMPEEVKYLVEEAKVGYLVDDSRAHDLALWTFDQSDQQTLEDVEERRQREQLWSHALQTVKNRREALKRKSKKKGGDDHGAVVEPEETTIYKDTAFTAAEIKLVQSIEGGAGSGASGSPLLYHEIPTATLDKPEALPAYKFYQEEYGERPRYDRLAAVQRSERQARRQMSLVTNSSTKAIDTQEAGEETPGQKAGFQALVGAGGEARANTKAMHEVETAANEADQAVISEDEENDSLEGVAPGKATLDAPKALEPSGPAYDIYKHFQEQVPYNNEAGAFYLTPGLRFGGQFVAYPGDPLRYHSHHIVTGFGYDEKFKVMDIIGGGRLGTAVKKTWFVGGRNDEEGPDGEFHGFSVEWSTFG